MEKPSCECHAEPMYWNNSDRHTTGGFWRCAVKHRERGRTRYANNPVYRIQQNMNDARRKRRLSVEARRGRLASEQEAV